MKITRFFEAPTTWSTQKYNPLRVWDIIKFRDLIEPDIVPELRIDGGASWDLTFDPPHTHDGPIDFDPPHVFHEWTFKIWIVF